MRGVFLESEVIHSDAYRSLTRWSHLVYLSFLERRVMVKAKHKSKSDSYQIGNNGLIVFPYREAEAMGISSKHFRDSIDQLQEVGLIDIAKYGKGGRSGESTLYWIDTRWRHYGTDRFQGPKLQRVKDTRQGRNGFTAYNARKKRAVGIDSSSTVGIDISSGKNELKLMSKSTVVHFDENEPTFRFAE